MIKPRTIKKMDHFIGRRIEWGRLKTLGETKDPAILIVYGRRRIGKTELLEQAYANRNILKFEGIRGKTQEEQQAHVLWQISEYLQDPLLAKLKVQTWIEVFKLIYDRVPEGKWTIYFEEVQWLACYEDTFISELKFAWDNYFRHREGWLVILCGSAPSFIINHIIFSKSLYNRSQHELHLKEFGLTETMQFINGDGKKVTNSFSEAKPDPSVSDPNEEDIVNLCPTKRMDMAKPQQASCHLFATSVNISSRSLREVMDAYLTVGGIPEYLKWCKTSSSVLISICKNSFLPDSFFAREFDRIFVSSLAENKHYKAIIQFLAQVRFASREEILKSLNTSSSGNLTDILKDIELCGFIEKYVPYNLNQESHLARYCISDHYLQFYYKFIHPVDADIQRGRFLENPTSAIKMDTYQKWLGFAFERFCRRRHHFIAKILGFHGIQYVAGAFYNKKTEKDEPGFQLDLVFDRADHVATLCEIKYTQAKIGVGVIEEFERKLELFPNRKKKTIQKVLIATEGASDSLIARHYFDHIITLEDLFAVD